MFNKIIITVVAITLGLTTLFVQAQPAKAPVKVVATTLKNAQKLAAEHYFDGTNVLLVNWSHYPVSVYIRELNTTVTLYPINSGGNTYYITSPIFFTYVTLEFYDEYNRYVKSSWGYNPGTIQIEDNGYIYAPKSKAANDDTPAQGDAAADDKQASIPAKHDIKITRLKGL